MSFFTSKFADRIGGSGFGIETEVFKFEQIKRAKRAACTAHPEIPLIDLGVGESDQAAFTPVVERLRREAGLLENRGYADNGIPEFTRSAVRYLENEFSVTGIDSTREILHCIGSKSAFAQIPLAFINPGDVALVTVPGYPILSSYTRYLGGEVYPLPLYASNGFLPDLDSIPAAIARRAKLLYINYPNNPTGALANRAFFEKVVEWAHEHEVIIVHDAAYGALVYDGNKPLSLLSIPGAKDVGIEVHSLSKSFNMTGWRLGFIAGNAEAVAAVAVIKDNSDSGQFRAIQKAGVEALDSYQLTQKNRERYSRRFDILIPALRDAGFLVTKSGGTFYVYAPSPTGTADGIRFSNAQDFSTFLIHNKLISTVPWNEAGEYIRLSVTFGILPGGRPGESEEEGERRTVDEIRSRLLSARLVFD